jgi:translation elongation factor EF-Ts
VFTTNVWDNDYFHNKERKYIRESTARIGRNIRIRRFRIFNFPNKIKILQIFSKLPGRIIKIQ